jgi:CubicO group peptidase (beta-lactamase class C family)
MRKTILMAAVLLALAPGASGDRVTSDVPPWSKFSLPLHFDAEAFGTRMEQAAKEEGLAGFALEVRQHGKKVYSRTFGYGRIEDSKPWQLDMPMHIASLSKTITSMALERLLQEKLIQVDTPVAAWLPGYWQQGPGSELITFRQLMDHTSGLSSPNVWGDYISAQHAISKGTGAKVYVYSNENYIVCRVLIAILSGYVTKDMVFSANSDLNNTKWDQATIEGYRKYVAENVFAPAGIAVASFGSSAHTALAYGIPSSPPGFDSGDLSGLAGTAGWHLSVSQLLDVLDQFRRKGTIVSKQVAQKLLVAKMAINRVEPSKLGPIYGKYGDFASPDGKQLEQSALLFLPADEELVIFVNSPIADLTKPHAPRLDLLSLAIFGYQIYVN